MSQKVIQTTLAAALAGSGTLTLSYPTGTNAGTFQNGIKHKVVTGSNDSFAAPKYFTLSFGSSSITLTWGSASPTLPVGTVLFINLDMAGDAFKPSVHSTDEVSVKLIQLGAPVAADTDAVAAVATQAAAADYTLTDTDGVVLDVPRNVTLTGATTDHSGVTFTVTGEDEYGNAVVENLTGPNNSTVAGVKAFKKVTKVHCDGAISTNGVSVGYGTVLGLPVFLPSSAFVVKEIVNNAAVTTGTFVAGKIGAKQSATTGDVRGTYDPATDPDGSNIYALLVALPDPDFLGDDQYAG